MNTQNAMNNEVRVLKSGRIIYRHKNNKGSVLEFDMFGRKVKLFVADAKYRTTAKWGTFCKDHDLKKIEVGGQYLNPQHCRDVFDTLDYTRTDAQVQKQFSMLAPCKTETAKHNTSLLMRFDDTEAAHKCRNVNIDGLGSLDLPNIYELVVLYLESDNIDNLDPTVDVYPEFALGSRNTEYRFHTCGHPQDHDGYISSTECTSVTVRGVTECGLVTRMFRKDKVLGVCPVKEL